MTTTEIVSDGIERRRQKLIALNKARATHGRANSRVKGYADRTYGIWQAFRDRCKNKNRSDYKYYGGRGITYDPAWDNFAMFLADMGEAPEGMTLDRINNDLGYSKENCRWADRTTQVRNSSRVRLITIGGETKPLSEWLTIVDVSKCTFYRRIKNGYSEQKALGL